MKKIPIIFAILILNPLMANRTCERRTICTGSQMMNRECFPHGYPAVCFATRFCECFNPADGRFHSVQDYTFSAHCTGGCGAMCMLRGFTVESAHLPTGTPTPQVRMQQRLGQDRDRPLNPGTGAVYAPDIPCNHNTGPLPQLRIPVTQPCPAGTVELLHC